MVGELTYKDPAGRLTKESRYCDYWAIVLKNRSGRARPTPD